MLGLAGQVVAVAYEITLAGHFGTGIEADALALSFTIVVAVANEIAMWISTLFIPRVIEIATKRGPAAATHFFRRCLLMLIGGTGVLALGFVLVASPLVSLLAPDLLVREPSGYLARLFAPLLVLLPLSVLLAGSLQAQGRFALAGLRQVCWYGMTLASLLTLSHRLGPAAVPVGMVVGLGGFCLILGGRVWMVGARVPRLAPTAGEPVSGFARSGQRSFPSRWSRWPTTSTSASSGELPTVCPKGAWPPLRMRFGSCIFRWISCW